MNCSGAMQQSPKIILVEPQMGENIGAAARAMHNFAVSELRIVNPRDGWPNERALSLSAGAKHLIEAAQLYDTLEAAIADCDYVLATTARDREMHKPEADISEMLSSRGLTRGSLDASRDPAIKSRDDSVAILFGPERTGLTNEHVTLAQAILPIPANPDYPSLNLGQAVNIVCYEWFRQEFGIREANLRHPEPPAKDLSRHRIEDPSVAALSQDDGVNATHGELQALFDQLEPMLDQANFWSVPEKKSAMWRNIRTSLLRADLSTQEVNTWHGIFRALFEFR